MNKALAELSKPTRQSPVAVVFILLKFLRMSIRQFWPIILLLFLNTRDKMELYIAFSVLIIATYNLIISLLSYYRYYFHIEGDQLIIQKGIFRKKKVSIPFDRIQTVNFEQNFLHQILQVVSLKIDTAGALGSELSIEALDRSLADDLRSYIMDQKEIAQAEDSSEAEAGVGDELKSSQAKVAKILVLKLKAEDLLKVGISQNHLRTLGLMMAFLGGFYNYIDEPEVIEKIFSFMSINRDSVWNTLWLSIPFVIILSILISLFNTLLRYYDLTVWKTEKGFQLVAGLFTRKESAARYPKIQMLRWYTGPVKRIFSLFTVRLFQAASAEVQALQAISIPGCFEKDVEEIQQAIFPSEVLEFEHELMIDPSYVGRMTLYIGILPSVLAIAASMYWLNWYSALFLLLIPLTYSLTYFFRKKFRLYTNAGAIKIKRGIIMTHWTMLEVYKVQSVNLTQSIYQRRHGLADVEIFTAAGSVEVPYLKLAEAVSIKDYLLFKVESTRLSWM